MAQKTKKKTKEGKITINRQLCKGCYLCVAACPNQLIAVSEALNEKGYYPAEFPRSDEKNEGKACTGCAVCALVCPDVAIEVYRE